MRSKNKVEIDSFSKFKGHYSIKIQQTKTRAQPQCETRQYKPSYQTSDGYLKAFNKKAWKTGHGGMTED